MFPGLPTLACCTYMEEMGRRPSARRARCARCLPTEECLDKDTLRTWLDEDVGYQCYPALMPRHSAIDLMTGHGLDLVGAFPVAMSSRLVGVPRVPQATPLLDDQWLSCSDDGPRATMATRDRDPPESGGEEVRWYGFTIKRQCWMWFAARRTHHVTIGRAR